MRVFIALVMFFVLSGSLVLFAQSTEDQKDTNSYLDIPFKTITGEAKSLRDYQGKPVMIVNTASKCGFTPQYEGLQKIFTKYEKDGLIILGFPANNFMKQEPGSNEEIAEFCRANYGVSFSMMEKISVKGKDIHPLYHYLTKESPKSGKISWNFNKFLLDKNGAIVERFGSKVKPESKDITSAIEKLIGKADKDGCADCSDCPGCVK